MIQRATHGPQAYAAPAQVETLTQRVTEPGATGAPWWRVGMMWLVIGGPLAVVVAGVATVVIAVRGADPVLTPSERGGFAERPAIAGRNHVSTGDVPSGRR